jgi:hypothetical protein
LALALVLGAPCLAPAQVLQAQIPLLLIGAEPATDRMLLWSGEHSCALSMQDLVQAIHATPEAV